MTRDAIVERLAALSAAFGGKLAVQYRARDLEDQDTDDLRTLLTELEAQLDDGEPLP